MHMINLLLRFLSVFGCFESVMEGAVAATRPELSEEIKRLQRNAKTPILVYVLTIMAVLGGFLFGYDTGVVSGAMIIIRDDWPDVDDWWQSVIVSVTVGVAAIFALISGWVNEVLGRRPGLIIGSILFIIGPIVCAVAENKETLVGGRVILGMAIGFASASIPHYIAECSPIHIRGAMVTLFQLLITFGLFMASVLDAALAALPNDYSWKIMLGIPAIIGLIQFVGFIFMPESPRWLATHGKTEQAKAVLARICANSKIAELEFEDIMETHHESEAERAAAGGHNLLITMFREPHIRRAMVMAGLMQMFQQLCGINTVMYYSTSIIIMSGVEDQQFALWLSCITSGVNFVCTFLGLYLIEKIGRKMLLLISVGLVTLCLVILGISFVIIQNQANVLSVNSNYEYSATEFGDTDCTGAKNCDDCSYIGGCGYCYNDGKDYGTCMKVDSKNTLKSILGSKCSETPFSYNNYTLKNLKFAPGYCPNTVAWLPILGMVLYLCSFSIGFGPVPWTLIAETFPNFCRSTGNAMATAVNWAFNLLISLTFLLLANAITREGAFFLYAGITAIGWVSFYFLVPETKGKTLEELKDIFKQPWFPGCCESKQQVSPNDSEMVTAWNGDEDKADKF